MAETIQWTPPGTRIPGDYETTAEQWAALQLWPVTQIETWDWAEEATLYRYTLAQAQVTVADIQAVFPSFALGVAPPPANLDGATRSSDTSLNLTFAGPLHCEQGCPGYIPRVVPPHTTVELQMRPSRGGVALVVPCSVLQRVDPVTLRVLDKGRVEWAWPAGALAAVRVYRAKFRVSFVDGSVEFFPSDEFEDVVVEPPA